MSPLPEMMIAVLAPFAGLFSSTVWSHAQVSIIGAILCQGPRTVAAALRVMGLGQEPRFERYHRVLNRARWSGLQAAKILLGLLLRLLPPPWVPLIVVDDTVERRQGERIKAKGCYRDAVRSTQKHVVTCFGLKWVCLMLLVRLPWSSRLWALPFLTVLAPSEQANPAGEEAPSNHGGLGLPEGRGGIPLVTAALGVAGGWGLCLPALGLDLCPAGGGLDQPVAVGCPVI